MFDFLTKLFDTSSFPRRWDCGVTWREEPGLGWLHVISDSAIFGAYFTIPVVLAYFVIKRKDLPFLPVFWMFTAFILACGLGHAVEATLFWHPWYRLSGAVKLITAVVSWATVAMLIPTLPKALAMRGALAVNDQLRQEMGERQRTERLLRHVIDSAPNGMLMIDADGTIQLANVQIEAMFGYAHDKLIGQKVENLVPERLRDSHPNLRNEFFRNPRSRAMGSGRDLFGRHRNGYEFPVEIGLNPITTDVGLNVLASVVDITERKHIQQELAKRSDEINARNRDLQTLLYVVSHDLREPLRAVGTFSRMVQDRYQDQLDEKGRDLLGRVVRAVDRMNQLLDDILTLSRAQRLELADTPIGGAHVVDEALNQLRETIEQSGAVISCEPDLPRFRGNKTWATQAIYNLVANALKFTAENKPPEIEIGPYRDEATGDVGIAVCDRGPGFSVDHAERIFQLFQRAVGRDKPGTGAGLAIVRQIAERHGGRAWAELREGGGSRFVVTFGPSPTVGQIDSRPQSP